MRSNCAELMVSEIGFFKHRLCPSVDMYTSIWYRCEVVEGVKKVVMVIKLLIVGGLMAFETVYDKDTF